MFRDLVMFAIGLIVGWWLLPRPQWADNAWQWLKGKLSGIFHPPVT